MQNKKTRSAHAAPPSKRKRPAIRKAARAITPPRPGEDGSSKGMLLGYARVSTVDQNLALQRDALAEAGCQKIFTEQISGTVRDRPQGSRIRDQRLSVMQGRATSELHRR